MRLLLAYLIVGLCAIQAYSEQRFDHSANAWVRDKQTGLVWQDTPDNAHKTFTWRDAKRYCAALRVGALSWRLPTQDELLSIIDFTQPLPEIYPVFVHVVQEDYWTNDGDDAHQAKSIFFGSGCINDTSRQKPLYVRCVHAPDTASSQTSR